MKKIAIALGVLAVVAAAMSYNIWSATQQPVTSRPGPLEIGRQKLHSQLEEAKRVEGAVERQAWESAPQLQVLIKGHEQRIEKLSGNSQAGEILAYDHESITRLQKRIASLAAEEAAKAAEQVEQTSPVN